MLNHIPVPPFFSLRTVVICLQTLVNFGSFFLCKGDRVVRQRLFGVMPRYVSYETYQNPSRSKERGDVWNQIPVNLSGLDHPKFKVNKRATRDSRLTLLITKHKAKIRQLENAT